MSSFSRIQPEIWTNSSLEVVNLWLDKTTKLDTEWSRSKGLKLVKKDLLTQMMLASWQEHVWRELSSRSWPSFRPLIFMKRSRETSTVSFLSASSLKITIQFLRCNKKLAPISMVEVSTSVVPDKFRSSTTFPLEAKVMMYSRTKRVHRRSSANMATTARRKWLLIVPNPQKNSRIHPRRRTTLKANLTAKNTRMLKSRTRSTGSRSSSRRRSWASPRAFLRVSFTSWSMRPSTRKRSLFSVPRIRTWRPSSSTSFSCRWPTLSTSPSQVRSRRRTTTSTPSRSSWASFGSLLSRT